ncbi:hypothetical protein JC607_24710 [Paracoccus sp. IB05]|nr:hypothetical protein [Paracoccus sp. IB05]
MNETLVERLNGLESERIALALVTSGQFQTTEAAQLFAEAMIQGGGSVDKQTEAMIRQIGAAAALNEELQKVARDPVKEWMKSVPNWLEAGKQIEMGAIESLKSSISDFIKTGKFDINNLGEAILGTISEIVADKAVKELLTMMGRGDQAPTGGLGGLLSGLFSSKGDTSIPGVGGDTTAQMMAGGQQAGTAISTAMLQAGQQISAQLQSALFGGGAQVGASAQSGLASGAASVRAAGQQGLAIGSAQMTSAGATAGTTINQAMVAGGQSAASSISMGMAGGGGGGFLSGLGGWQGIASMVIPGLFSEGGHSHSPVSRAAVPSSAFANAPHYSQGTANTSGIPAILHDNEAVIPLSRGRKIGVELNGDSGGGGSAPIIQHMNFTVNSPNPDAFRRSEKQIAADMASAGQRAVRDIR